jgi:hypothetical protein
MHYCTHDNHFKFGWGTGLYNFDNKQGKYWVEFGRAKYKPKSFREECVRAAKLIYENATKPLLVCFSGGIDSEVIVRSLQEANAIFSVVIMKINYKELKNINQHDTCYAFDYATKHNIPIIEFEFDLEDFIKNKFEFEADAFGGNYLGILSHTEIVKNFPEYHCILGGGDIKLKRHRYCGRPELEGLFIEESEISISAIEAAYKHNGNVSNRFFMHTPELMLAWLLDYDISHFIKYEKSLVSNFTIVNSDGIKAFAYYRHWPDMLPRPKFNGYEKLTLWKPGKELENDPKIIEILRKVDEKYKNHSINDIVIDYNQLIENLLPI